MEKFVKSVNVMDETILVPCRLMDLKVGDEQDITELASAKQQQAPINRNNIKDLLYSADLFDLFNMLNAVKVDLLWAQSGGDNLSVSDKPATKGHIRRPSTVSMASTNSAASVISDSESDTGNENDSGIEAEEPENKNPTQEIANNFRRHLSGLYTSLQQLTDAANYLTIRYQHDVGSPIWSFVLRLLINEKFDSSHFNLCNNNDYKKII